MDNNSLMTVEDFKKIQPLSDVFFESGVFKDVKSAAQATVKILAGREIGLSPMESMMKLYLIEDKVCISSALLSSFIKKSKFYDYEIEKLDDTECVIKFLKFTDKEPTVIGKSYFTLKDAAKAGVINKTNWKSYPRNMLFARAIANGARWFIPDIYSGYVTEEMEPAKVNPDIITINEEGEVTKNGKTNRKEKISEPILECNSSIGSAEENRSGDVV